MKKTGKIYVFLKNKLTQKREKYIFLGMTNSDFEEKIPLAIEKGKKILYSKFAINSHDIEDILQNAALKAFKNFPSFKGKSSFDTWFISITLNEAKNLFNSYKKSKIVDNSENIIQNYSFTWIEPEIYKKEKEVNTKFVFEKCLKKFSPKHREVLNLLRQEYSQEDISKKLNIPISSVRTRFFYAKKNFKKFI
jgi:RNA polymerase sigma-70 factor (ECF subfamily)